MAEWNGNSLTGCIFETPKPDEPTFAEVVQSI